MRLADGSVLISGGYGKKGMLASTERFDPTSGRWAPAASLPRPRAGHRSTLLADGRVLVTGGLDPAGDEQVTTLVYHPLGNRWQELPGPTIPRFGHSATLLADGRVLVAGGGRLGRLLASAELYDPQRAAWRRVADMPRGAGSHTAFRLASGRVLVMDDESFAVEFDPVTERWRKLGPEPEVNPTQPFYYGEALTLLANGLLLRTGGDLYVPTYGDKGSTNEARLFDPATGAWRPAAKMPASLYDHMAVALADGRALIAGGTTMACVRGPFDADWCTRDGQVSTFIYDPQNNSWSTTQSLRVIKAADSGILLADGSVLALSGSAVPAANALAKITERFYPSTGQWKSAQGLEPEASHPIYLPGLSNGNIWPKGPWLRLTDGPRDEWQPVAVPGGNRVVYLTHEPEFNIDDGRMATFPDGAIRVLDTQSTWSGSAAADPPFLSPDGRWAYLGIIPSTGGQYFQTFDLDLCPSRPCNSPPPESWQPAKNARRPALSPDGSLLAYDAEVDGQSDLFLLHVDTGRVDRLTTHPAIDRFARFAPDSRSLVFRSERDGNSEIYRIGVDGQGLTRLTDHPAHDGYASFAPDGKQIVFQSNRDGLDGVYVMAPDGSGVQRITDGRARYVTPQFAADGRSLLLASDLAGRGDLDVYLFGR